MIYYTYTKNIKAILTLRLKQNKIFDEEKADYIRDWMPLKKFQLSKTRIK